MTKKRLREIDIGKALLLTVAVVAVFLVGCQQAEDSPAATIEVLRATVAGQKTTIATLMSAGASIATEPVATRIEVRQPTVDLPTAGPVSTVQRPPTATPSPRPSSTPTSSPTATPIPDAAVGETLTNLRSGPGVGHAILVEVEPGTPLELVGRSVDGEWFLVRLVGGLEGWMFYLPMRLNIPADSVPVIE